MRYLPLLSLGLLACRPASVESPAPKAPSSPRRAHSFETFPADTWASVEALERMDPLIPPYDPVHGAGRANQVKARFTGKDRAVPKTTIDGARMEEFPSIVELQSSLPTDDAMRNHHTPELTKQTMDRAAEEKRNVHVTAWIYAIKFETDDDFHLIIGTEPGGAMQYFNAEVSGLPATNKPAYKTLTDVRESLADILNNSLPGPGTYRKYNRDPIKVTIEGSLFYDVDHEAGAVGPEGMKPTTAWEIHPITSLVEE